MAGTVLDAHGSDDAGDERDQQRGRRNGRHGAAGRPVVVVAAERPVVLVVFAVAEVRVAALRAALLVGRSVARLIIQASPKQGS